MIHLVVITSLTLFYFFTSCFDSKRKVKKITIPSSLTPEEHKSNEGGKVKEYLDAQLKEELGFDIDREKAIAIARTDQNLLLRAGPGSGKTTTIAYKIFYLIKKENIKPEEIMALAFNREAAKKLRIKIRKDFGLKEFQNIKTFHSLAYQLVKPKNKILYGKEMLKVIEDIVKGVINEENDIIDFKITELFTQFIQRAKKSEMTPNDIQKEIKINYFGHSTGPFLSLANKTYQRYEGYLSMTNRRDFDDLLKQSIEVIDKTKGECTINIAKEKKIKTNDLKYIFIDEFQDFTHLFYNLIDVIKKYNKDLKLWCVGDSNQAINGWAGSHLKYFNNFSGYFDNAGVADLLTNYRSKKVIVEASNIFMAGGEEQHSCHASTNNNRGGEIIFKYARKDDNGSFLQGYLKLCLEIIVSNPNKSIAILHRKNEIEEISLSAFCGQLEELLGKDELKRIEISTIHQFKGRESDIIIVLQVCKKIFPLIHPYNVLFKVFGWSQDAILSEEKRIFFVGITRAREKLCLLTEIGNESMYIRMLTK